MHRELLQMLTTECSADRWLQHRIQRQILADLHTSPPDGARALREEIIRRAEPRYLQLWNLCSPPEKLVLRQLAEEGLVNPDSREALRELLRKRLLVRTPSPKFMNESFRLWVRRLPESPALNALEQAGEGGWDKWRNIVWPALFVCVLFLLATQRKYFDNIVPFLSALGAEITALMKMVNAVKTASGRIGDQESS